MILVVIINSTQCLRFLVYLFVVFGFSLINTHKNPTSTYHDSSPPVRPFTLTQQTNTNNVTHHTNIYIHVRNPCY